MKRAQGPSLVTFRRTPSLPTLVTPGLPPISGFSEAATALFPNGKALGNVALACEGKGALPCPW